MKKLLALVISAGALVVPATVAGATQGGHGGGHTPVTICHKPGTPAEHTIVVDDDAVPAHLAHGDYLGECQVVVPPTEPPVEPPTEEPPVDEPPVVTPPTVTPEAPVADVGTPAVVVAPPAPVAATPVVVTPLTAG